MTPTMQKSILASGCTLNILKLSFSYYKIATNQRLTYQTLFTEILNHLSWQYPYSIHLLAELCIFLKEGGKNKSEIYQQKK